MAPTEEGAPGQFYGATGDATGVATGDKNVAEGDQPVNTWTWGYFADVPALLIPWWLFAAAIITTALMRELFLSYLTLGLGCALGLGFIWLSRGKSWQVLALTVTVAALLGHFLGRYDHFKYLQEYDVYKRSLNFDNVPATSQPAAFMDAASLSFSNNAFVDPTKGVGYKSNDLWCVAPVVSSANQQFAGYWAVGTNCCRPRGLFSCGNVWNTTVRSGLVIKDAGFNGRLEIPYYKKAVEMAARTYNLIIPDEPTFIQWDVLPEDFMASLLSDAVSFCVWASVIFLVGVLPLFRAFLWFFQLSLFDRRDSREWHPDKVEVMQFGIDIEPREYPVFVQRGLLNGRCYWSGEVIHDYAFHISNKHMFLGCLFAHPAHPYSKRERILVCVIVCLLIVWPVAAYSVKFGDTGIVRTIIIAIGVTVPRNLLKLYLIHITQTDSELELEKGFAQDSTATQSALYYEIGFLAVCLLVALIVVSLCSAFIRANTEESMNSVLWENCDGLGFAFILEPLFDLLMPYSKPGKGAERTYGFFGRWRMERDEVEQGDEEPMMMRRAEIQRGVSPLVLAGLQPKRSDDAGSGYGSALLPRRRAC